MCVCVGGGVQALTATDSLIRANERVIKQCKVDQGPPDAAVEELHKARGVAGARKQAADLLFYTKLRDEWLNCFWDMQRVRA